MKSRYKVLLIVLLILLGASVIFLSKLNSPAQSTPGPQGSYPHMHPKSASSDSKIVAKVDGKEITEEELIGSDIMMHYNIKQREFEFKQARLRNYITQHYVSTEAKRLGIDVNDYIRNHIVKDNNVTPTEQEISEFAKSQNLPPLEQLKQNEQAWGQINNFLRMRKEFDLVQIEVNKWTKNHKVEYYFPRPSLPIDIPVVGAPTWGPSDAKVTIIEFGDFECPFCAKVAPTVMKLKKIYGDKIRLVYKHMPLAQHAHALSAALTSTCIANQSSEKFWQFYSLIYQKSDKLNEGLIRETAKKVKTDLKELDKCLENPTTKAQLLQDGELVNRLGLESTPVFFINGEMLSGSAPVEAFQEAIDYYLEEK
jgi:protein-disulfide isomerase